MDQRLLLKIFGEVQGINFRSMVKVKCIDLKLKGYVKNNPNGSVTVEAEGDKQNLEDFVEWVNKSPGFSKVKGVDDYWSEAKGEFNDFTIEYIKKCE